MIDLNELVWNKTNSWLDKINILSELKFGLESKITNDIPLTFTTSYRFRNNYDNLSYNDQWKEVDLAIKILNVTKNWDRYYTISWSKMVQTDCFIEFFRDYINASKFRMNENGCHCYKDNHRASIKTLLSWASKLYDKKLINKEIFNKFLEFLEDLSI